MITKTFYTVQLSNFQFPNTYYSKFHERYFHWDFFEEHVFDRHVFDRHFFSDKDEAINQMKSDKIKTPSFIYDLVEVTVDVKVCQ